MPLSDIDEARAFIKRKEKRNLYAACRAKLPSLLLKLYPTIYKLLMSELKEDYGGDLDKKVEQRLLFLPSIPALAERARMSKKYEAARREERRQFRTDHPELFKERR